MRSVWKSSLAATLVAATLTTAWAEGQDDWWGRHTSEMASAGALAFALNDPMVRAVAADRFVGGNHLVDHGAANAVPTGGGFEVSVYLNFEPAGGAPVLGDVEVIVGLDPAGVPTHIVALSSPTPVNDPLLPGAGGYQTEMTAYEAVTQAMLDPVVASLLDSRFATGRELWDQKTVLASSNPEESRYRVKLILKNPDGSKPPAGERRIVIHITVATDLTYFIITKVVEK